MEAVVGPAGKPVESFGQGKMKLEENWAVFRKINIGAKSTGPIDGLDVKR